MIRLHVIAEGRTEQGFVKNVLAPHLAKFSVFADARCVLTSRDRHTGKKYRGGLMNYEKAKNDIARWLKEDDNPECRFTTMFDLYALPDNFPGYTEAMGICDPYERIRILEKRLAEDTADRRFIPYIQLHEFEALILADPQQLGQEYLEHDSQIQNLVKMVSGKNPELINDGPETAPSKRILREIPEYKKTTAGPAVAEKIGIATLRTKCRHFRAWLSILEQLK